MIRILLLVLTATGVAAGQEANPAVTFEQTPGTVTIQVAGKPFATYVYEDAKIPRPYFCDFYAPNGVKVTRNNPPIEGQDLTDHDTYHPGVWLAFGDISGGDFWRNTGQVRHVEFVEEPKGDSFTVKNSYESGGKQVCLEEGRYTVLPRENGALLLWNSVFWSPNGEFAFGDQEEMGLGVRMATPLTVEKGKGVILNSDGLKNEEGAWGKKADWCDYSGAFDQKAAGVTLMAYPKAFRDSLVEGHAFAANGTDAVDCKAPVSEDLGPAWFHARDYGLLVANQFGRNAFTEGPKLRVVVPEHGSLRLHFGVYVHDGQPQAPADLAPVYQDYLKLAAQALPETGDGLPRGPYIDDKLTPKDKLRDKVEMRIHMKNEQPPEVIQQPK